MAKSSMTGSATWISRDTKTGRFIDRFTVPGQGEVRVMPSQTIVKAKQTAAGRLRAAIAHASARNAK